MSNDKEFKTPDERYDQFKRTDESVDNEANRTTNDNKEEGGENDQQILSTSGSEAEKQEDLGGGTNLSLDQLKESEK